MTSELEAIYVEAEELLGEISALREHAARLNHRARTLDIHYIGALEAGLSDAVSTGRTALDVVAAFVKASHLPPSAETERSAGDGA
jgi:hypothetical protein